MNILKKLLPLIVLLVLSYWSIKPLLQSGFFPMHDDTQVARVYEMHKSLTDGMFPVRWVQDLGYGYGYPIFNFYAPLAYYIGAKFMLFGADALLATKLMIGSGILFAGVFMYFLAKEFWGKIGGIVAGLLYIYAPYHALNAYVRGAISELWAYAFIPLAFFAIYKIFTELKEYVDFQEQSAKRIHSASSGRVVQSAKTQLKIKKSLWWWVCLSAISYAGIILSHNLTAMMATPFLFVFAFFLYVKLRLSERLHKPYFVLLGLLIGIMLSAFYWLPVPFEMKYTDVLSVVGGGSDYKDHFACFAQLWNSPWGFAGSAPGCTDGFSLKIGKLHILLGFLSLAALIPLRKNKHKFQIVILYLLFLLASIFLTLSHSKFIWDSLPQMAFFQFPWRFLLLSTFFLSFIGGGIFSAAEQVIEKNRLHKYIYFTISGAIMAAAVYLNAEMFAPQRFINADATSYTSTEVLNWKTSAISDEYMPKNFVRPLGEKMIPRQRINPNNDVVITNLREKTQQIAFTADARRDADLRINLAYFPGWHVYIDGKQEWFGYYNRGMQIRVPQGEHDVAIRFAQTSIEKIGNTLSAAGVLILFIGIIAVTKNKSHGKKIT